MKVLIFGASGFIGGPVAAAFARAGHTVIGTTRSEASTVALTANEIIPLVLSLSDPDLVKKITAVDPDVVIDCVGGSEISNLGRVLFDAVAASALINRPDGPALEFIYTGGTWVHGNHPDEQYGSTSDRAALRDPMTLTKWRLPHERHILSTAASISNATSLSANIIRPSLLYGYSGSITAELMESARSGEVKWAGKGDERIATVHADDLAELFVLVAEKSPIVKGLIFEGSNPYPEPISHILAQLVKVSGAKGPTYTKIGDPFHEAIASTNLLRPTLGKSLVGWIPRKAPLAQGMEVYYKAFLSSKVGAAKL